MKYAILFLDEMAKTNTPLCSFKTSKKGMLFGFYIGGLGTNLIFWLNTKHHLGDAEVEQQGNCIHNGGNEGACHHGRVKLAFYS